MDALVPYAIWICLVVSGLAFLAIVVFGLRNLAYGKVQPITIITLVVPAVLMGALGLDLGDWALAGIWTFLIMLVLASISLLLSGMRGLIGM